MYQPGSTIGPYTVLRELARGGMGVVLAAHDPRLEREVALKLLLDDRLQNEAARERFEREVKLLARLQHPNVIAVHGAGEHEGHPYLAMDLVQGESLEERVHRGGPLPPRDAARITLKLALALTQTHGASILHRDIKPANVLIDGQGEPLLTDFGLARDLESVSRLTKTGRLVGTPSFWSPEQAAGEKGAMGPPTDVYSLGATLYMMLTGQPPFDGANLLEIVIATREQPPTPPRKLRPEVPRRLERICLDCLNKDPAARPDPSGLATALQRFLKGKASAESVAPPRPGRGPELVMIGGGVALILMVVALVLVASRGDEPEATPGVESSESVEKTSALEPSPDRPVTLADRLQHLEWNDQRGNPAEHLVHYRALMNEAQPGSREELRARQGAARMHLRQARLTLSPREAIASCGKAVKLDPKLVAAWMLRGRLMRPFDPRAAASDYSRALELDADLTEAYYQRALLRVKTKQLPTAVQDLTEVLERGGAERGKVYGERGAALFELGKLKRARNDLRQATSQLISGRREHVRYRKLLERVERELLPDPTPPLPRDLGKRHELQVIYFVPSDRQPARSWQAKITTLLAFVADFYRSDLQAKGHPTRGLDFEHEGGRLKVHLVRGKHSASHYSGAPDYDTGRQMQRIEWEVDRSVPIKNRSILLVLCETYDGGPSMTWAGDLERSVRWSADQGRAFYSSWILRDDLCATTPKAQVALLTDPKPLPGTSPPLPRTSLTQAGMGKLIRCLNTAFGLHPDNRDARNISLWGFKRLRWNYSKGAQPELTARLSPANARMLANTRFFREGFDASDATPPKLDAPDSLKPDAEGRLRLRVEASDAGGLAALSLHLTARFDILAGRDLEGERSASLDLPLQLPSHHRGATEILLVVSDRNGNHASRKVVLRTE